MTTISLKTDIPGPKSRALSMRRETAVPRGITHASPVFIERAQGASAIDVDGNVFLDFAGGLGCLNVGHGNPHVVKAVVEQAAHFLHTCFQVAPYEPYVALAEKLNAITPGNFAKKTLLLNSGAEAVENAVKIARYFTGRPAIIGFEHGFSGRTLLTMSLTSKVMPYKLGFGPLAPEVYRMPYPYFYRSGFDDEERFTCAAVKDMESFFATHVDPSQVACVVMELILGEGGFVVAPGRYVQALADFCRTNGILLVVDEIQTGFARTGKMFAAEHYGIEPDLVTTAKSLAGGLPISSVTGRSDIMDSVHPGGLGGTFCGNPVACRAALAAIGQLEELDLCRRAEVLGDILRKRLLAMAQKSPHIGEVRGLGAMMAIELVEDRAGRKPAKEFTGRLIKRCIEHGVLLIGAGTYGNVLRFLIPLVMTEAELNEGLDIIEVEILAWQFA